MTQLPVRLRAQALEDIKDIFDWIVKETNHHSAAEQFINRIYDRCESIGEFPLKGIARDDLKLGIRVLNFERKAVIAYRLLTGEIEVTNIFYGGRDWEAAMLNSIDFDEGH
ncbi:MAG: type II toxin-antitoxin system RelE/ParE family toxin [Rhizobiaceae bacterium]